MCESFSKDGQGLLEGRVLRRGGCHRRRLEGAQKAETRPFAEYEPLQVRATLEILMASSLFFFFVLSLWRHWL